LERKVREDENTMSKWPNLPWPIVHWRLKTDLLQPFLEAMEKENLIERIWQKDWTVWGDSPEEISNRLGWLEAPQEMLASVFEIEQFVSSLKEKGFRQTLLLGMGGSSLAPEVLNQIFPSNPEFLHLEILDSTVPEAIRQKECRFPPDQTLYIISSKSGTTTETLCLFHYFFARAMASLGREKAPSHFIAITDPSTPLVSRAASLGFRKIWPGNPEVGGRFSALTNFGLVPAALKGIALPALLYSARRMQLCCQNQKVEENPGALLAAFLAATEAQGRDKILFWIEPELIALGDWLEQLVAESTGKKKKGLLPVTGQEELFSLASLEDVAFIGLGTSKASFDSFLQSLEKEPAPFLCLAFEPQRDIGALFFLWEWAISLAASFWQINPFDQPDVEKTKILTREILQELKDKGGFPTRSSAKVSEEDLILYFSHNIDFYSFTEGLIDFLKSTRKAGYLCLQAFLPPERETKLSLDRIIHKLIQKLRRPIISGWGPRYLHSTGQFHKGGRNDGFFWQLIAEDERDLIIPESPGKEEGWLTFGSLKEAQARADYQALATLGKKIIQLHLGRDYLDALQRIEKIIDSL
jgi:glucose-6-phosphate isomerase/transaldolase/glucose-6-phosphate isomerase